MEQGESRATEQARATHPWKIVGAMRQEPQQDMGIESGLRGLTLEAHDMSLEELDKQSKWQYDQFMSSGRVEDIDKAIEYVTLALESTPAGDPAVATRKGNLGVSHNGRFRRLGILDDLEKAIEHGSRAVVLTPEGHPDMALRQGNLGNFYGDRFRRLGEMDDLEKAIEHKSRALALTPDGHPHLSYWYSSLGVSYTHRFRRMGEVQNLEKAIEHHSRALAMTPDGHPHLSHRHTNLGLSYTDRFERMGEMRDLEKAIEHHSRALALTPHGHPDLSDRYANLGVSYTHRFKRMGKMDDLEKSIEYKTRALALTLDGHPHLSRQHAGLGVSYAHRFKRTGKMQDLEKAIKHKTRALALTPDGHPDLSDRHAALGVSYSDRFRKTGEMDDLEKAAEHHSRALALTPDGRPDLPDRYFNRAYTFFSQYQYTNDPAHLTSSLQFYRKASQLSTGAPRTAFQNALKWAKRAVQHSRLNCIEAYQTTIDLLPQFIWLGATTSQRYQDLSQTENLAINAARAAILRSDPDLALEWLEHARCVVWNQSLMLRTPLDELQSSHPDLSSRLESVSKQLNEASIQPSVSQSSILDSENFELAGQTRRRLAQEYSDLLEEVRKLPGFGSFLQPMKSLKLVHAARYGPIVVINCHKAHCDALVILPGEGGVKHLPLPDFTAEQAQGLRFEFQMKGLRQRGVKLMPQPEAIDRIEDALLTLWIKIVKPVLDFLEYTIAPSVNALPHTTWCPTGALSFLPLHAAGDYRPNGSKVFDYAISSYTPTVTALFEPTPSLLTDGSRVLAIGQACTPGHSPLPGTAEELAYIKAHIEGQAKYSQLTGNQATTRAVIDAMEDHDWVHLACHAHQNVEDPTHSGFYLHDGTLDLASINRRQFRRKGLAFLSACQTATGDEKLPDEAVHLASGMLMAGYTSVIATMWSVYDSDAPLVADKVYRRLMEERRLGNGEAGRALHYAVAELRKSVGEKSFGRWLPYIHIGS